MAEIIHFTPKPELSAAGNLAAFVEVARTRLTIFGADLPFDAMTWDTGDAGKQRGLSHRIQITFSTLDTRTAKQPTAMAEPFGSFAKACIRYLQGLRPTKNQQFRVGALRALECALTENGGGADPVRIEARAFDRAAQLIKREFSEDAAYRIGGQLETVANLLREKRLTAVPVNWRNALPRPSDTNRIGAEFDQRRQEKMPTPAALDAVATAFLTVTIPGDVIRISAAALMCSAPDRVGEVLTIPADCEVRQARRNKDDAYGLRWWPAKGAAPMVKWIVPSMCGIVQQALEKIRCHTEEARHIAAWYEAHPAELYLPEDLAHLRGCPFITVDQASDLLGLQARSWADRKELACARKDGVLGFDFGKFERAALTLLPRGFPVLDPITGLTYKDALFVVLYNQFRTDRTPSRCMVEPTSQQHIGDALGGRLQHGHPSVFSRLDLTEPNDGPIEINSHQFRHWLNTLAQQGGLSQLDIAKWSGRRDVRQNRAYDHMSSTEILVKVRESVGETGQLFGPLAAFKANAPLSRAEYARLEVPTAHTTDLGVCIHDFAMLPCQLHRECLNCVEHVCIKGDRTKTERIRARLDEARALIAAAERAGGHGAYGAGRWRDHHLATLERLEQLVGLLDDPTIPEGAVIQLGQGRLGTMLIEPERPPPLPNPAEDNGPERIGVTMDELRDLLSGMGERG